MKLQSTVLLSIAIATAVPAAVAVGPQPAAASQGICVMLLSEAGAETLINRCRDCREVTLSRSRPGGSIPNVRQMMLPPAAATQTPFRGPGRTRIVGERSCPPVPGSGVSKISFVR
jgi:hypothetical protein